MITSITLGAVGDICLSGTPALQLRKHDPSWLFEPVRSELARADLLFGNMESVLLPADFPDDRMDPTGLVTKTDGSRSLKEAGFAFMNLANNHIMDGGYIGMFHTRDVLKAVGIASGGVGRTQEEARQIHVLHRNGLAVGFLCYAEDSTHTLGTTGPCHAYFSRQAVLDDIAKYRSEVDVLVVSVHADLEFMETPSLRRREISRELARAGATVVLQHHPHVPQGAERVDNSLIVYSLGNFCFHSFTDPHTRTHLPYTSRSFILLVKVSARGVESFSRVPVQILEDPCHRPVLMTGKSRDEMLNYINRLDALVLDDKAVRANWRRAALQRYDKYLKRIRCLQDPEAVRHMLGRLLFVEENLYWVREVREVLREEWLQKMAAPDPYHRPRYAFMRCEQPVETKMRRFKRAVRKLLSLSDCAS